MSHHTISYDNLVRFYNKSLVFAWKHYVCTLYIKVSAQYCKCTLIQELDCTGKRSSFTRSDFNASITLVCNICEFLLIRAVCTNHQYCLNKLATWNSVQFNSTNTTFIEKKLNICIGGEVWAYGFGDSETQDTAVFNIKYEEKPCKVTLFKLIIITSYGQKT